MSSAQSSIQDLLVRPVTEGGRNWYRHHHANVVSGRCWEHAWSAESDHHKNCQASPAVTPPGEFLAFLGRSSCLSRVCPRPWNVSGFIAMLSGPAGADGGIGAGHVAASGLPLLPVLVGLLVENVSAFRLLTRTKWVLLIAG